MKMPAISDATKVRFSSDTIAGTFNKKKTSVRIPTPRIKSGNLSNKITKGTAVDDPVVLDLMNNLQFNLKKKSMSDKMIDTPNPSLCETPVRNKNRRSFHEVVNSSEEEEEEGEEFFDDASVIFEELEDKENIDINNSNANQSQGSKKKLPSMLTGTAWKKQIRRRLSISNTQRLSEKFQPASTFDFTKEKKRRSCVAAITQPLNTSVKVSKPDRRLSIKLLRSKLNPPGNMKQSVAFGRTQPINKSIILNYSQNRNEKYSENVESQKETPRTQESKKKIPLIPKKTAPSIVNTENGIMIKEEEILYFGIPLEVKKKNTKVVPFSFEARNKQMQEKKKLKELQQSELNEKQKLSGVNKNINTSIISSNKIMPSENIQKKILNNKIITRPLQQIPGPTTKSPIPIQKKVIQKKENSKLTTRPTLMKKTIYTKDPMPTQLSKNTIVNRISSTDEKHPNTQVSLNNEKTNPAATRKSISSVQASVTEKTCNDNTRITLLEAEVSSLKSQVANLENLVQTLLKDKPKG